jgi:hypothetical protein
MTVEPFRYVIEGIMASCCWPIYGFVCVSAESFNLFVKDGLYIVLSDILYDVLCNVVCMNVVVCLL